MSGMEFGTCRVRVSLSYDSSFRHSILNVYIIKNSQHSVHMKGYRSSEDESELFAHIPRHEIVSAV